MESVQQKDEQAFVARVNTAKSAISLSLSFSLSLSLSLSLSHSHTHTHTHTHIHTHHTCSFSLKSLVVNFD